MALSENLGIGTLPILKDIFRSFRSKDVIVGYFRSLVISKKKKSMRNLTSYSKVQKSLAP